MRLKLHAHTNTRVLALVCQLKVYKLLANVPNALTPHNIDKMEINARNLGQLYTV